jgi:hypothetical protein
MRWRSRNNLSESSFRNVPSAFQFVPKRSRFDPYQHQSAPHAFCACVGRLASGVLSLAKERVHGAAHSAVIERGVLMAVIFVSYRQATSPQRGLILRELPQLLQARRPEPAWWSHRESHRGESMRPANTALRRPITVMACYPRSDCQIRPGARGTRAICVRQTYRRNRLSLWRPSPGEAVSPASTPISLLRRRGLVSGQGGLRSAFLRPIGTPGSRRQQATASHRYSPRSGGRPRGVPAAVAIAIGRCAVHHGKLRGRSASLRADPPPEPNRSGRNRRSDLPFRPTWHLTAVSLPAPQCRWSPWIATSPDRRRVPSS